MKKLMFRLLFVTVLLLFVSGCADTIKVIQDEDLTHGCKVREAQAKLGYFNQEGTAVACILKCSEKLPQHFYYKYDNDRTGCHVQVGTKPIGNGED